MELNLLLNDYLLIQILMNIEIKELLIIALVSKQFKECVDSLLRQKRGLSIGYYGYSQRKYYCDEEQHYSINSDISYLFQYKMRRTSLLSETPFYDYEFCYDLCEEKNKLKFILNKCTNIKALYLNKCFISSEVIQIINNDCKQLKCLTFDNTLNSLSDQKLFEELAKLFSKGLIHLTTNCYINSNIVNKFTFNTIKHSFSYLSKLQYLYITIEPEYCVHLFNNFPETVRTLELNFTEFRYSLDSKLMSALVEGKGKLINKLYFGNYISNEALDIINNNLDLTELSFVSNSLTFKLLSNLAKKQKNLCFIGIGCLTFSDEKFCFNQRFENVLSLVLFDCFFHPKIFPQFLYLFPNLKKLVFNNSGFYCICNETNSLKKSCYICYEDCYKYLSNLSIEVLKISSLDLNQCFIKSLKRYPNLHTIILRDNDFNEIQTLENKELLKTHLRYLLIICIEICVCDSNIKLTIDGIHKFIPNDILGEIPTNLRVV